MSCGGGIRIYRSLSRFDVKSSTYIVSSSYTVHREATRTRRSTLKKRIGCAEQWKAVSPTSLLACFATFTYQSANPTTTFVLFVLFDVRCTWALQLANRLLANLPSYGALRVLRRRLFLPQPTPQGYGSPLHRGPLARCATVVRVACVSSLRRELILFIKIILTVSRTAVDSPGSADGLPFFI